MTTDAHTIIVTDANVLINLMHVTRLDMCARLRSFFSRPRHQLFEWPLWLRKATISVGLCEQNGFEFRLCRPIDSD